MNRDVSIGGIALAAFVNLGAVALAQAPAPTALHMGAGASLVSGKTAYFGGTDTLEAGGTTVSEWTAGTIGHITNFFTIIATGGGTLGAGPRAPATILGNPSAGSAAPVDIAIGANLTLAPGGTLSASAPGTGTVTEIDTGTGLTGGPVTGAGTIGLAGRGAATLMGNPGTAAAPPSDIAIGANLTLTPGGTLSASAPGTGTVTQVNTGNGLRGGPVTGAGTISAIGSIALTGTAAGTLAVAPGSGTSDVLIAMPAGGGTVTLGCTPSFAGQRWIEHITQGATAGVLNLGTAYIFGTAPSSYTISATPGLIDRLAIVSPDNTHCAVLAIDQGFSF